MIPLKIQRKWKCNWQITTLTAVASGLGAAIGCALLPWWTIFFLLPAAVTLNRRQLAAAAVFFSLCAFSGIIREKLAENAGSSAPECDAVISGTPGASFPAE